MRARLHPIELFGTDDHDGLTVLFDDALWALRAHAPEQLAEARLGLVKLPDSLWRRHDYRLD